MARPAAPLYAEPLPEADVLEGFPHPRQTLRLYGQSHAERVLVESLAGGRMPHAWLLAGQPGIGKATLAYRFAAHALGVGGGQHGPAPSAEPAETSTLRRVRALSHPGLLVIRRVFDTKAKRFTATIPVDEVRRLRAFLALTASGAEAGTAVERVIIVDQADELNASSANALLKSLEEPPPGALFLLVASRPGRLLATIRSRCRLLPMPPLGLGDLRSAAEQAMAAARLPLPAEEDWPGLADLARGSVRRLLGLATEDGLRLARRAFALIEGLPRLDWGGIHALAEELAAPAAEQRLEAFFDILLDRLARLLRAAAAGQGNPHDVELAQRLLGDVRLASWAELWETIVREKAEALALNLDRRTLVLETFSRLEKASHR